MERGHRPSKKDVELLLAEIRWLKRRLRRVEHVIEPLAEALRLRRIPEDLKSFEGRIVRGRIVGQLGVSTMTTDDEDDDSEFAPAEEIVYRMDVVIDALDVIERILGNSDGLVIPDADRRRMKALLLKMMREADELFDLATTVAHLQTTLKKGTN